MTKTIKPKIRPKKLKVCIIVNKKTGAFTPYDVYSSKEIKHILLDVGEVIYSGEIIPLALMQV